MSFAVDPNTAATSTDATGRFNLDYRTRPAFAGIQITLDVPTGEGSGTGRFDWRGAFDPETPDSVEFEIPTPKPCLSEESECGTPLLPDLVPIVNWDQLSEVAQQRLQLPDEVPANARLFPATSWFVEETEGRRLLRFATVAANLGTGPLDVIADADPGVNANDETVATVQRIWTDTWHFSDQTSGEFVSHPTHDHIHFDAFERYRLLDDKGEVVASSEKVSFCLRDSVLVSETRPAVTGPMLAVLDDCGDRQQVINPGFGDHYHALLDDQWIDVSGIAAGTYTLEITVDPNDLLAESDESNNTGQTMVTIE